MAHFIELEGLDEEDIVLLETLAERLRKKAKTRQGRAKKKSQRNLSVPEDVLSATAGAWKDTIDCEELKRRIYEDRLSSRPEVRL